MQSINEELQSTNEELETSKEELQSVNEELTTVNAELQSKVAELTRTMNDMNNLLAGTGIGTLFVDHQLRILRFTPAITKFINLIQTDVGRPVGHIVSNLVGYDNLVADVKSVLDTLVPREVEVKTAEGRWYQMRILPYRTLENVIEGAVITFVDITTAKEIEESLRESEVRFRQLVESLPQLLWTSQPDGRCDYVSPQWLDITGLPETEQRGFDWVKQVHPDDRSPLLALWKRSVATGVPFTAEFRIRQSSGEYRWIESRAHPLRDGSGTIIKWFGFNLDITDRKARGT